MPPFSMFLPMMMGGGGPQQQAPQPPPDPLVPPRVRLAMEFLALLHAKQIKRGAVAEGASQTLELDGIPITTHEEGAEEAACEMLSAYFRGSLNHDAWEGLRFEVAKRRAEPRQEREGKIIVCPSCQGQMGLPCICCNGGGKVLISPLLTDSITAVAEVTIEGGGIV